MGIKLIKIFIVSLTFVLIVFTTGKNYPTCSLNAAKQSIVPTIFFEQAIDDVQNVYLTRILHNKVGILAHESSLCYFSILNPIFIYKSTSILGLLFWIYCIYKAIINRRIILLSATLVLPIIYFFGFLPLAPVILNKLIALEGLRLFVKEKI